MDRGAWWATVYGAEKELDTTKQLTHTHKFNLAKEAELECIKYSVYSVVSTHRNPPFKNRALFNFTRLRIT